MKKRLLAGLMVLCMVLSLVPFGALAAQSNTTFQDDLTAAFNAGIESLRTGTDTKAYYPSKYTLSLSGTTMTVRIKDSVKLSEIQGGVAAMLTSGLMDFVGSASNTLHGGTVTCTDAYTNTSPATITASVTATGSENDTTITGTTASDKTKVITFVAKLTAKKGNETTTLGSVLDSSTDVTKLIGYSASIKVTGSTEAEAYTYVVNFEDGSSDWTWRIGSDDGTSGESLVTALGTGKAVWTSGTPETITLSADVALTETLVLNNPNGTIIDLNGHTITGTKLPVIQNLGTLTIQGSGAVYALSNATPSEEVMNAVILNGSAATNGTTANNNTGKGQLTISGGVFSSATAAYILVNEGETVVINDGTFIGAYTGFAPSLTWATATGSSAASNYITSSPLAVVVSGGVTDKTTTMSISNGKFATGAGVATIDNKAGSTLQLDNGEVQNIAAENGTAVTNEGIASIAGGTITGKTNALTNNYTKDTSATSLTITNGTFNGLTTLTKGKTIISGGTFKGVEKTTTVDGGPALSIASDVATKANMAITGGTFDGTQATPVALTVPSGTNATNLIDLSSTSTSSPTNFNANPIGSENTNLAIGSLTVNSKTYSVHARNNRYYVEGQNEGTEIATVVVDGVNVAINTELSGVDSLSSVKTDTRSKLLNTGYSAAAGSRSVGVTVTLASAGASIRYALDTSAATAAPSVAASDWASMTGSDTAYSAAIENMPSTTTGIIFEVTPENASGAMYFYLPISIKSQDISIYSVYGLTRTSTDADNTIEWPTTSPTAASPAEVKISVTKAKSLSTLKATDIVPTANHVDGSTETLDKATVTLYKKPASDLEGFFNEKNKATSVTLTPGKPTDANTPLNVVYVKIQAEDDSPTSTSDATPKYVGYYKLSITVKDDAKALTTLTANNVGFGTSSDGTGDITKVEAGSTWQTATNLYVTVTRSSLVDTSTSSDLSDAVALDLKSEATSVEYFIGTMTDAIDQADSVASGTTGAGTSSFIKQGEAGSDLTIAKVTGLLDQAGTKQASDMYLRLIAQDGSKAYYKLNVTIDAKTSGNPDLTGLTVNKETVAVVTASDLYNEPADLGEVEVPFDANASTLSLVVKTEKAKELYYKTGTAPKTETNFTKITAFSEYVSEQTIDKTVPMTYTEGASTTFYFKVVAQDGETCGYYKLNVKVGAADTGNTIKDVILVAGENAENITLKEGEVTGGTRTAPTEIKYSPDIAYSVWNTWDDSMTITLNAGKAAVTMATANRNASSPLKSAFSSTGVAAGEEDGDYKITVSRSDLTGTTKKDIYLRVNPQSNSADTDDSKAAYYKIVIPTLSGVSEAIISSVASTGVETTKGVAASSFTSTTSGGTTTYSGFSANNNNLVTIQVEKGVDAITAEDFVIVDNATDKNDVKASTTLRFVVLDKTLAYDTSAKALKYDYINGNAKTLITEKTAATTSVDLEEEGTTYILAEVQAEAQTFANSKFYLFAVSIDSASHDSELVSVDYTVTPATGSTTVTSGTIVFADVMDGKVDNITFDGSDVAGTVTTYNFTVKLTEGAVGNRITLSNVVPEDKGIVGSRKSIQTANGVSSATLDVTGYADNTVYQTLYKLTFVLADSYTVSFAAGEGATGSMDDIKVIKVSGADTTYTLPTETTFTAPAGKEFDAWTVTAPTDDTVTVKDGVLTVKNGTATTVAITLTATWKEPTVKVLNGTDGYKDAGLALYANSTIANGKLTVVNTADTDDVIVYTTTDEKAWTPVTAADGAYDVSGATGVLIVKKADANLDGTAAVDDVQFASDGVLAETFANPISKLAADLTGDGEVFVEDVQAMADYVLSII